MDIRTKNKNWMFFLKSEQMDLKRVKEYFRSEFSLYFKKYFRRFRRKIIVLGKMVSITYQVDGNEFIHRFKSSTPMITTGSDDQVCFPAMITPQGIIDLGEVHDHTSEINPAASLDRRTRRKTVSARKKTLSGTKKKTSIRKKKVTPKKKTVTKKKINVGKGTFTVTTAPYGRKKLFSSKHKIAAIGHAQRLSNEKKKSHMVKSTKGYKIKISPKRKTKPKKKETVKT